MLSNISEFFKKFWSILISVIGIVVGIFLFLRSSEDKKIKKAEDRIKKTEGSQEVVDSIINSNQNDINTLESEQEAIEKDLQNIKETGSEEKIEDFFNKRGFWCLIK